MNIIKKITLVSLATLTFQFASASIIGFENFPNGIVDAEYQDFFDIEANEKKNKKRKQKLLSAFDIDNEEIFEDLFLTPNTGDMKWGQLDFNVPNISSAQIKLRGSGAIENTHFTAVPEPSSLVLFALGMVGLGLIRKRTKNQGI